MKHNIGISGIRVKSNSLLLALFLLLVWCVQIVPGLGNAYAQYVYPAIARVLSSFSRLVPFAIGDLFIALSIAGLLLYPVYARHIRKQRWKSILLADAKYLLWVYVWFYLAWGLNYSQKNFYERTHIPYIAYTPENFQKFVDSYIKNLNGSYTDITSIDETLACHESVRAYNQISDSLGVHRPFHQSPRVKTMLFTPLISMVGVTGSMGPFFCEFTLNGDLLPSQYPATYAHELAHLLGITSEAEANFYAYQVCTRSQVKEIRFSGYFSILPHVLGNARVGVTGSMGPFFCEFTLNGDLLPSQYPATYAHELAHLLGITSEAEANFYAYQVCTRSQVKEIRFSGYFSILPHVLGNARRLMNEEEYAQLLQRIRPEIIGLAQTNSEYWMKKYNPVIGSIQDRIYDLYLKGNKIESGRKNYSEVVGLLISYEEWKKNRIFAPVINQQ